MASAVYIFEQHGLKINGIEVDLTKRALNHAHWVTTRDIRKDEEFDDSYGDDKTLDPESTDPDGGIFINVEVFSAMLNIISR